MNYTMTFPDTWEEYERLYGFTDDAELYTNGCRLIPSFRVEQWLQHIAERTDVPDRKVGKWESNEYLYTTRQTRCSECKTEFYVDDLLNVGEGAQEYLPNYCPHCGARMYEVSDE